MKCILAHVNFCLSTIDCFSRTFEICLITLFVMEKICPIVYKAGRGGVLFDPHHQIKVDDYLRKEIVNRL